MRLERSDAVGWNRGAVGLHGAAVIEGNVCHRSQQLAVARDPRAGCCRIQLSALPLDLLIPTVGPDTPIHTEGRVYRESLGGSMDLEMRLSRSELPLDPAWDLCLGSGGGAWVSSPHAVEMLEVPIAESAGLRITSAFLGVQVLSSQPRLVMG